jgi:hypothetical protein
VEALSKGGAAPSLASPPRPAVTEKKNSEPVLTSAQFRSAADLPSRGELGRATGPAADMASAGSATAAIVNPATATALATATASSGTAFDATATVSATTAVLEPSNPVAVADPATELGAESGAAAAVASEAVAVASQGQPAAGGPAAATEEEPLMLWMRAAAAIEGMLGDFARLAVGAEQNTPDEWTIIFPAGSGKTLEYCEVPSRKQVLVEAFAGVWGRQVHLHFRSLPGQAVRTTVEVGVSPAVARSQLMRQMAEHPYVSKICEVLQGEITRVDPPQAPARPPEMSATAASAARP